MSEKATGEKITVPVPAPGPRTKAHAGTKSKGSKKKVKPKPWPPALTDAEGKSPLFSLAGMYAAYQQALAEDEQSPYQEALARSQALQASAAKYLQGRDPSPDQHPQGPPWSSHGRSSPDGGLRQPPSSSWQHQEAQPPLLPPLPLPPGEVSRLQQQAGAHLPHSPLMSPAANARDGPPGSPYSRGSRGAEGALDPGARLSRSQPLPPQPASRKGVALELQVMANAPSIPLANRAVHPLFLLGVLMNGLSGLPSSAITGAKPRGNAYNPADWRPAGWTTGDLVTRSIKPAMHNMRLSYIQALTCGAVDAPWCANGKFASSLDLSAATSAAAGGKKGSARARPAAGAASPSGALAAPPAAAGGGLGGGRLSSAVDRKRRSSTAEGLMRASASGATDQAPGYLITVSAGSSQVAVKMPKHPHYHLYSHHLHQHPPYGHHLHSPSAFPQAPGSPTGSYHTAAASYTAGSAPASPGISALYKSAPDGGGHVQQQQLRSAASPVPLPSASSPVPPPHPVLPSLQQAPSPVPEHEGMGARGPSPLPATGQEHLYFDIPLPPDLQGKSVFGPASYYITHTWHYRFEDLTLAILQHYCRLPEVQEGRFVPVYYWLDVFAVNQQERPPPEFKHQPERVLEGVVGACKAMLLMARPWPNSPVLSRAWPLFEVQTARHMGVEVEVLSLDPFAGPRCLTPGQLLADADVSLAVTAVDDALNRINMGQAISHMRSEHEVLMKLVNRSLGGLHDFNESLRNFLRPRFMAALLAHLLRDPSGVAWHAATELVRAGGAYLTWPSLTFVVEALVEGGGDAAAQFFGEAMRPSIYAGSANVRLPRLQELVFDAPSEPAAAGVAGAQEVLAAGNSSAEAAQAALAACCASALALAPPVFGSFGACEGGASPGATGRSSPHNSSSPGRGSPPGGASGVPRSPRGDSSPRAPVSALNARSFDHLHSGGGSFAAHHALQSDRHLHQSDSLRASVTAGHSSSGAATAGSGSPPRTPGSRGGMGLLVAAPTATAVAVVDNVARGLERMASRSSRSPGRGTARSGRGGSLLPATPLLTAAGVDALAQGLRSNTFLLKLQLSGHPIGCAGLRPLVQALCSTQTVLTTLLLRGCCLGPSCGNSLYGLLRHNTSLTALDLGENPALGSEGVSMLGAGLARNSRLQELWLDCTGGDDASAVALAAALAQSPEAAAAIAKLGPPTVSSSYDPLEGAPGSSLVRVLNYTEQGAHSGHHLTNNNSGGFDGANARGGSGQGLATLRIDSNGEAGGGGAISARGCRLQCLDVRGNGFGPKAASALAAALKGNSSLVALQLSGNAIETPGALALAEALLGNSSLRTLELRDCGLALEAGAAFGSLLRFNTTLASLDLGRNPLLGCVGVEGVAAGLICNWSLRELRLDGVCLGPGGTTTLSKALVQQGKAAHVTPGGWPSGRQRRESMSRGLAQQQQQQQQSRRSDARGSITSLAAPPAIAGPAAAAAAGGGPQQQLPPFLRRASSIGPAAPGGGSGPQQQQDGATSPRRQRRSSSFHAGYSGTGGGRSGRGGPYVSGGPGGLEVLDLSDNDILSGGAVSLAAVVPTTQTLREMWLENCQIEADGKLAILAALQLYANSPLRVVRLAGNGQDPATFVSSVTPTSGATAGRQQQQQQQQQHGAGAHPAALPRTPPVQASAASQQQQLPALPESLIRQDPAAVSAAAVLMQSLQAGGTVGAPGGSPGGASGMSPGLLQLLAQRQAAAAAAAEAQAAAVQEDEAAAAAARTLSKLEQQLAQSLNIARKLQATRAGMKITL